MKKDKFTDIDIINKQITSNCNLEVIRLLKSLDKEKQEKLSVIKERLSNNYDNKYDKHNKSKYGKWRAQPGVYLIYFENKIIYVGETDDLKRRIVGDIAKSSKDKKRITHTFIRGLVYKKTDPKFNIKNDSELKKTLEEKFLFSYIETKTKILAQIIERIIFEKFWEKLWNKEAKLRGKGDRPKPMC